MCCQPHQIGAASIHLTAVQLHIIRNSYTTGVIIAYNITNEYSGQYGKQDAVEVDGATIGELLDNLTRSYSGLKPHLYNEQGKLRSFVNVYLNDEDIRYLEKEKTAVKPGDTISIIPSVAGGATFDRI